MTTDDKLRASISEMDAAAERLRRTLNAPEPSEVVIVRPKAGAVEFFVAVITTSVIIFSRGALISWGATHVSFVPDFGYWESLWIGLLAAWIFQPWSSGYTLWSRSWGERRAAARDLIAKKAAKR